MTKLLLLRGAMLIVLLAGLWPLGGNAQSPPTKKLPYVYTNWKHFTVKDGLPDDPS